MTSIERLGKVESEIGGLNRGQSMTLGAVGIVSAPVVTIPFLSPFF